MSESPTPRWLTAFVDFPEAAFDAGTRFWSAATGYPVSELRGEQVEFASLIPPDGAAYLKVQRLGAGPTRLHLDLHVDDPWTIAEAAEAAGGTLLDRSEHGYLVLRSPAGIVFCLVTGQVAGVPSAAAWPPGHTSRVDEVVFDVPSADLEAELAFFSALAGGDWSWTDGDYAFSRREADGWALRLRLQPATVVTSPVGHLHIRTDDRDGEVARLVAAGATVRAMRAGWTVMDAPGGMSLCVLAEGVRNSD